MVRLLTSLVAVLLAGLCLAQDFGRFGYVGRAPVPGFVIDEKGFRINYPSSDYFYFAAPQTSWTPYLTSALSQSCRLTGGYASPLKYRQELTSPGFSLYFPQIFRLKLTSISAPYLSTAEASLDANSGYPAPASPWLVVSFRDKQPPLVLGFPEKQVPISLTGKSGAWVLESTVPLNSWVRMAAPLGLKPLSTNSAAELGRLSLQCKADEAVFAPPAPKLVGVQIEEGDSSIEVRYKFDRAGAIIPLPIILAPLAGSQLRLLSKHHRLAANLEDGPTEVADEPEIRVRFPARRIPTGRALTLGGPSAFLGTASYLDYASIYELAMSNLMAGSEPSLRQLAQSTAEEYITDLSLVLEPNSHQNLPYSAEGKDLDLVAAHALLNQCNESVLRPGSTSNSLLASLWLRVDWRTWSFLGVDQDVARRTQAFMALVGALASEPERRLWGCQMQASLLAGEGLRVWQRRQGLKPEGELLEPLSTVRDYLYSLEDYRRAPSLGNVLTSGVRVYGDVPVTASASATPGQVTLKLKIEPGAYTFSLASAGQIRFLQPSKVWDIEQAFGVTTLTGKPAINDDLSLESTFDPGEILAPWAGSLSYEESRLKDPN